MRGWLFAIVALATMAVMTGCGNAAAAQVATGTPRPTATPIPTPVDDVTAVRTLVRRFMDDWAHSAISGNIHEVDRYAVPYDQAWFFVVGNPEESHDRRKNFMVSRVEIDPATWTVDVSGDQAKTFFWFRGFGHDATWPGLRPLDGDQWGPRLNFTIHLRKSNDQWLFTSIDAP